jgi:hypothetical protein
VFGYVTPLFIVGGRKNVLGRECLFLNVYNFAITGRLVPNRPGVYFFHVFQLSKIYNPFALNSNFLDSAADQCLLDLSEKFSKRMVSAQWGVA